MKKHLIRIIIFFILLVIADRSIAFLISRYNHLLINEYSLEEPMKEYLEGKKFNTLILGTSRTYSGIHPVLLESEKIKPFKWSDGGNGAEYNYYFYRFFKKLHGRPETVIYGVDFFIYKLVSSRIALSEIRVTKISEVSVDFSSPAFLLLKYKHRFEMLINDMLNSHQFSEKTLRKKIYDMQVFTGHVKAEAKQYQVHTDIPENLKKRKLAEPPGIEGDYFFKLLDEFEKDGVKVVLLIIPDHIGTYRSFYKKPFIDHLKNLSSKYENIKIVNYNHPTYFDLSDESLFLDGGYGFENSHLSKKGALIVNAKLKIFLNNNYGN